MMLQIIPLVIKHQKPVGVSLLPLSLLFYMVMTKYGVILRQHQHDDAPTSNPNLSPLVSIAGHSAVLLKLFDLNIQQVANNLQYPQQDAVSLLLMHSRADEKVITNIESHFAMQNDNRMQSMVDLMVQTEGQHLPAHHVDFPSLAAQHVELPSKVLSEELPPPPAVKSAAGEGGGSATPSGIPVTQVIGFQLMTAAGTAVLMGGGSSESTLLEGESSESMLLLDATNSVDLPAYVMYSASDTNPIYYKSVTSLGLEGREYFNAQGTKVGYSREDLNAQQYYDSNDYHFGNSYNNDPDVSWDFLKVVTTDDAADWADLKNEFYWLPITDQGLSIVDDDGVPQDHTSLRFSSWGEGQTPGSHSEFNDLYTMSNQFLGFINRLDGEVEYFYSPERTVALTEVTTDDAADWADLINEFDKLLITDQGIEYTDSNGVDQSSDSVRVQETLAMVNGNERVMKYLFPSGSNSLIGRSMSDEAGQSNWLYYQYIHYGTKDWDTLVEGLSESVQEFLSLELTDSGITYTSSKVEDNFSSKILIERTDGSTSWGSEAVNYKVLDFNGFETDRFESIEVYDDGWNNEITAVKKVTIGAQPDWTDSLATLYTVLGIFDDRLTDSGILIPGQDGELHLADSLSIRARFLKENESNEHVSYQLRDDEDGYTSWTAKLLNGNVIDLSSSDGMQESVISHETAGEGVDFNLSMEQARVAVGSNYSDRITGNSQDNVIAGREGMDTMTGEGGQDIFVFEKGVLSEGFTDTITDFDVNEDRLNFLEGATGTQHNYVELDDQSDMNGFVEAANENTNGTIKYVYGTIGSDGYLAFDDTGSKITHIVQITGVTTDFDYDNIM